MPDYNGQDWGVTVDHVSALAPHIPIARNASGSTTPATPARDDVYKNSNTRIITENEVAQFIADVSAIVSGRILRAARLPETSPFHAYLTTAASAVVKNGAGHYLVAAAFPINAAPNANSSYAEVLRLRFEEGLAEIEAALEKAIGDAKDDGEIVPLKMAGISYVSRPPAFDDLRRY